MVEAPTRHLRYINSMSEKETERITGTIVTETDKAILFQPDDSTKQQWIPRSLVPYMKKGTTTQRGEIKVEAWFAYKHKLVV